LNRQRRSFIKSSGNKLDCLQKLGGRGKTGFRETKTRIITHLNQPQTPHLMLSAAAACCSSLPPSQRKPKPNQ
jgi:hypothetical protein